MVEARDMNMSPAKKIQYGLGDALGVAVPEGLIPGEGEVVLELESDGAGREKQCDADDKSALSTIDTGGYTIS